MNISRQSVSQWERGKAYPDIDNLKLLCRLYNITLDELVGGITSKNITELKNEKDETAVLKKEEESNKEALETTLEVLCLAVVLVLAAQFAFWGLVIPVGIACWMKRHRRKYKVIYFLLTFCFLISTYNLLVILDYLF